MISIIFADLLQQIDNKADEYVQGVKGMVPEKRNEKLKHIQKLFSKSREYGDDKVQLAMQTYEMVRLLFHNSIFVSTKVMRWVVVKSG